MHSSSVPPPGYPGRVGRMTAQPELRLRFPRRRDAEQVGIAVVDPHAYERGVTSSSRIRPMAS